MRKCFVRCEVIDHKLNEKCVCGPNQWVGSYYFHGWFQFGELVLGIVENRDTGECFTHFVSDIKFELRDNIKKVCMACGYKWKDLSMSECYKCKSDDVGTVLSDCEVEK